MEQKPLYYAASKVLSDLRILTFGTIIDLFSKQIGLEYEFVIKYKFKHNKQIPILLNICGKEQYFYNSYLDDNGNFCLRFIVPQNIGYSLCIINDCGLDFISQSTIINTLEGIKKVRATKRNPDYSLSLCFW